MKKFNKIVTVIVAFAMIVSSLTMLAIHDEHVHVHAAAPETGKVWALHDKNANDEYIAFSESNTGPFTFTDVHLWYDGNFNNNEANATGNNEHYDGRTFGVISRVVYEGESVKIGAEAYTANKAITYQRTESSFIAAVVDSDNTYGKITDGTIWAIKFAHRMSFAQ